MKASQKSIIIVFLMLACGTGRTHVSDLNYSQAWEKCDNNVCP